MTNKETQELRDEKLYEMKNEMKQDIELYQNYTVFFDKFMDLFGDNLIEMKKFCDRYDWDFDSTIDMAKQEI